MHRSTFIVIQVDSIRELVEDVLKVWKGVFLKTIYRYIARHMIHQDQELAFSVDPFLCSHPPQNVFRHDLQEPIEPDGVVIHIPEKTFVSPQARDDF